MVINKNRIIVIMMSALVFLVCMNVSYVTNALHLRGSITLLLRILLIVGFMLKRYKIFLRPRIPILLLYLWYLLILISTVINHQDLTYAIVILSRSFLICVFCEYYRGKGDSTILVLETWEMILTAFCVIDLLTMVIYKNGMPTTGIYTNVWFLGYKTARMAYTLPLVYISCILSYLKKKKIDFKCIIITVLSAIGCLRSSATAASIMMIIYVVALLFISLKSRQQNKKMYQWLNEKTMIIGYLVFFICVVIVQSTSWVQFIIQDVLGKSRTLSNRTVIWAYCLEYIKQKPILGWGYLTTDQYTRITTYTVGTSSHNMLLTILMTTGILGFLLYLYMFSLSVKRRDREYTMYEVPLILATVVTLIVGLTSSVLVFSMFTFLPYYLLTYSNGRGYNYEFIKKNMAE